MFPIEKSCRLFGFWGYKRKQCSAIYNRKTMTTTFSHSIYHMISANISHDSFLLFLHAISGCTKTPIHFWLLTLVAVPFLAFSVSEIFMFMKVIYDSSWHIAPMIYHSLSAVTTTVLPLQAILTHRSPRELNYVFLLII